MFTGKRLTEAFESARIEYFDDKSKYIIFSDVHRGDNSLYDEFSRNLAIYLHALDYYFHNGYVYIEAGDGDELWKHKKFNLVRQAHIDVYLALKKFSDQGRLILIYGNHNIFLKSRDYVQRNLYKYYDDYNGKEYDLLKGVEPVEAVVLRHRHTRQEILTVHGHQGDLLNDRFWFIAMIMLRYLWRFTHITGLRNPFSPSRNTNKQCRIERAYNKWIETSKTMLICGHTHRARFPGKGDPPYFNAGCCVRNRGITGIEISEGKISLVEWQLRADRDGRLRIKRTIRHGPEPIEKYCLKRQIT